MASISPHNTGPKSAAELFSARGLIIAGLAIAASVLSICFLDAPLFEFVSLHVDHYAIHRLVINSGVILAAAIAIAALVSLRGPQSVRLRKVLTVVIYSAISAIGTNDFILKAIFARPLPDAHGDSDQVFAFFRTVDSVNSSFPSGHSGLAVAAVTVLWRFYPAWRTLYLLCLAVIAFFLLAGEWHYLSDLIAGALWGWICASVSLRLLAPIVREA